MKKSILILSFLICCMSFAFAPQAAEALIYEDWIPWNPGVSVPTGTSVVKTYTNNANNRELITHFYGVIYYQNSSSSSSNMVTNFTVNFRNATTGEQIASFTKTGGETYSARVQFVLPVINCPSPIKYGEKLEIKVTNNSATNNTLNLPYVSSGSTQEYTQITLIKIDEPSYNTLNAAIAAKLSADEAAANTGAAVTAAQGAKASADTAASRAQTAVNQTVDAGTSAASWAHQSYDKANQASQDATYIRIP